MTGPCGAFVAKPLYCSGGNSSGSNRGSNSKNNSSNSSNELLYDYGTYDKQPGHYRYGFRHGGNGSVYNPMMACDGNKAPARLHFHDK